MNNKILLYTENHTEACEIAISISDNKLDKSNKYKIITTGFDWNNITIFWWQWEYGHYKNTTELGIEYTLEALPILPKENIYKEEKNMLINHSLELLKDDSFDLIIFSWDSSRLGLDKFKRLYLSSLSTLRIEYIWKWDTSKNELRKLWKNRLLGHDKLISWEIIDGLIKSARIRNKINWKIAMNFSQLFTLYSQLINGKYINFNISENIIPTLNIIYTRDKQIRKHKDKVQYKLETNFAEWFKWYLKWTHNKNELLKINTLIIDINVWIVKDVISKETEVQSPYGLNWTTIKLSIKLNSTPKRIIDKIEEMHYIDWIMSYPRVESKYISTNNYESLKQTILFLFNSIWSIPKEYVKSVNYIVKNNFHTTIPIVNNNKVIDWHWALHIKVVKWDISKKKILTLIKWNDFKSKIFKRILDNNLGFFLPSIINKKIKIEIQVWDYIFISEENFIINNEYNKLNNLEEISYLQNIIRWDIINIDYLSMLKVKSKKLILINTDSIFKYMKLPNLVNKEVSEKDVNNSSQDNSSGLWQKWYRDIVIEHMIRDEYIYVDSNNLYITEKWYHLMNIVDNKTKNTEIQTIIEKDIKKIIYYNNQNDYINLNNKVDSYIRYITNNIIDDTVVKNEKEKNSKKKVLIELKSKEWYNLYMKKDKKISWHFYVTSDDNIWINGYPLYYYKYDPIKKKVIDNIKICNTKNLCPKCSSKMNIFESPNNNKLYIECIQRKHNDCKFVCLYNIKNDTIVHNIKYRNDIRCKKCNWRTHLIKSTVNNNYYAKCEFNNNNKNDCNFFKEYDIVKWEYLKPLYMRNASATGLIYNNKEIYENEKTFLSMDWEITIWKDIWWKKINITILKELISDWKTKNIVKWFISQKGNIFSARLKIEGDKIKYHF